MHRAHGVLNAGSSGTGRPQSFRKKFYNGRAPQKLYKVLAEKVSGYGNFRWFTYMNLYPCKMLTFWYTLYNGMTYMYKYMSASACAYIDFSLLSLNSYIVKNQSVYNWTYRYLCWYCKWVQVVRNMPVLPQHRTSCVKQCYSICAYILYSIV